MGPLELTDLVGLDTGESRSTPRVDDLRLDGYLTTLVQYLLLNSKGYW
jgi:3-hydroxyacyl-CoA dehydrogenase